MKHFPTIQDVENLIKNEKEQEILAKNLKQMQFWPNYTLSKADRIDEVASDIAIEYSQIPRKLREKIAKMESPIKSYCKATEVEHKKELRIYRLFNMMQVLYPYCSEISTISSYEDLDSFNLSFITASIDIKVTYNSFLEHSTYINSNSRTLRIQKVFKIMQLLKEFFNDDGIEIPSY